MQILGEGGQDRGQGLHVKRFAFGDVHLATNQTEGGLYDLGNVLALAIRRGGISKTTTNKKQERGQPCLTPCVVLNTVSSAPRKNVDPCSITREIVCSNLEGVPIRSSTPRIRALGGL